MIKAILTALQYRDLTLDVFHEVGVQNGCLMIVRAMCWLTL